MATLKRAEWLAIFDLKRRELRPAPLTSVTPELAQELALRVRARVIRQDDAMRDDPAAFAPITDAVTAITQRSTARRSIDSPLATTPKLTPWKKVLGPLGIRPHQQFHSIKGKNTRNFALVMDPVDLIHELCVAGFLHRLVGLRLHWPGLARTGDLAAGLWLWTASKIR